MEQYHEFLRAINERGTPKGDRTGTGTTSLFGYQMRFNLQEGFPAVTTKKLFRRAMTEELLWFLSGDTNNQTLKDKDVHIWDAWEREDGELGPIYGAQWRRASAVLYNEEGQPQVYSIDQMKTALKQIRENPNDRGIIVSAWNLSDLPYMELRPCHTLIQFYVNDGKLSLQLYQRSADAFLGVPFNIASYALLTHMVAHVTGYEVGDFVHTFGDAHIYNNHQEQVAMQLEREPYPLPRLRLDHPPDNDLFQFTKDHIHIEGYQSHPAIKADVSV